MTKKFLTIGVLCLVVVLTLCSFIPVSFATTADESTEYSESSALQARFLNMLNHNFVYNEMFYDEEAMLNDAALALIHLENDGFINESYLKDYVFNMYGLILENLNDYNEGFPKNDGKFYIIPRGFDTYSHSILSINENDDGSYTVQTKVEVSYHFDETATGIATTLFIRNDESQFGFNILYSDIEF